MMEPVCIGDNFEMLVTDWYSDSASKISLSRKQNVVTNATVANEFYDPSYTVIFNKILTQRF